ncbi:GL23252 [Drosophila persimilis]|uniref:GL23252 n=1 Tax=Drosophila persimilis TaxID=7234 RepID=B4ISE1_DROPE|nr:GL23252 [Drosophila persimilis]
MPESWPRIAAAAAPSCSCDRGQSSSCSSLDEDINAHEMTVAVECHQCNQQAGVSRRSSFCSCHTTSCCCGSCSQEEAVYAGDDDDDDDETTGQRESFCTAADHTIMSTPTQDGEEPHSSTLTPLSTQRSSLLDLAEHTMSKNSASRQQVEMEMGHLTH